MGVLLSPCSLCLLMRDVLGSGVLCSPCCAVLRPCSLVRCCEALLSLAACAGACVQLRGSPSPVTRWQRGLELWHSLCMAAPAAEPGPPQPGGHGTDGCELAAGSAPHGLGPGQGPLCACASLRCCCLLALAAYYCCSTWAFLSQPHNHPCSRAQLS